VILALQPLLSSRIRAITEHYGLDMILRFHRSMAVLAVGMLIAHPILLAASSGHWRLITGVRQPWPILIGKIALLFLLVQVVTSLWHRRMLDFEGWRKVHLLGPVVLVLGLTHSWVVGGDLEGMPMRVLWIALLAMAAMVYVLQKFVWPAVRRSKLWSVASVKQETHNVWTLEFEPPEGTEPLHYVPGQFTFIRLYRGDPRYDGEEHHFTISSSPLQGPTHTCTIKNSGDFTSTIGETKPGDRAAIHGPYGRFSYAIHTPAPKYLFIAGGIGITPLMGMLRHMRDGEADCDVTLLYGNKSMSDIVFREELDEIAAGGKPSLKVVYTLTGHGIAWDGETGYVDRELIEEYVGEDLSDYSVYLCAPDGMMAALTPVLLELGTRPERFHAERFWL